MLGVSSRRGRVKQAGDPKYQLWSKAAILTANMKVNDLIVSEAVLEADGVFMEDHFVFFLL